MTTQPFPADRAPRPDVLASAFMPLDIIVCPEASAPLAPLIRGFESWALQGALLSELPAVCQASGIEGPQYILSPGGSAANVVRVARKWGCRGSLVGVLGSDSSAEFIVSWDRGEDLDHSMVTNQPDRATPIYLIVRRGGKTLMKSLIPKSKLVRSVFQCGSDSKARLITQVRQRAPRVLHLNAVNRTLLGLTGQLPNSLISLNLPGLPERAEGVHEAEMMLHQSHLLTMSAEGDTVQEWLDYLEPSCHQATPESQCAALLDLLFGLSPTLHLAVITRGDQGSVAKQRGQGAQVIPAFGPIRLLDATGAGDVFTGVLLALLLGHGWNAEGLPNNVNQILVTAAAAASINCERLGASGEIPTEQEVEQRRSGAATPAEPRPVRLQDAPAGVVGAVKGPMSRLIAGIPAAVKATLGNNEFCGLIEDFNRTKTIAVIGSGSSHSLAHCVQRLVSLLLPAPYSATALYPLEYLRLARPGETTLLISQRGNPDIEAADRRARELGVVPFLITAKQGGWAGTFPEKHLFRHRGEPIRSFVNVRGPCAALALVIEWLSQQSGVQPPTATDYEARFLEARAAVRDLNLPLPSPNNSFIALASGSALGLLHELDLKAAEAGVDLETCELKGWTHGRYQRTWKRRKQRQQAFITLEIAPDASVVDELGERLNGLASPTRFPLCRLSATPDCLGLWKHLVHAILLIERMCPSDPTEFHVPAPLQGINFGITL